MLKSVTSMTNKELEVEYIKKNTLYSFVNEKAISFQKVTENLNNKQIECNHLIRKLRKKKTRSEEDISLLFNLWRNSQSLKMIFLIISRRIIWLEKKNAALRAKLWEIYNEMVAREAANKTNSIKT